MKLFWSALGLVLLSACAAPVTPPTPGSTPTSPPPTPGTAILISAHRGGAALKAENTLASFKNGIALGADYIEMDVHLSKDGVVMVMHDATVDRTTDGKGSLSNFTATELASMNADKTTGATSKEPVPTLGQVLDLSKPANVRLEVEIKVGADGKPYPGIEQKVLDEIAARGMLNRVKIMAFEFDTLKNVKALNPKVTTIALMTTDYFRRKDINQPAAILDDVASYGADGIGVDKNFLTPKLTEEAHNRKLLVGVWTVDTEAEMNKFAGMGVNSITSNRPDLLKKVLGK